MLTDPLLVSLPGKGGSEPAHWQSWLETRLERQWGAGGTLRIVQEDWDRPQLERWVASTLRQVAGLRRPLVFAAHSFGCLALAEALAEGSMASSLRADIRGVLLVAPASPARFGMDFRRFNFSLGHRAILVGSDNDPWMPAEHYDHLARPWGAELRSIGAAGHINTAAGFGPWPLAEELVTSLAAKE